ncbi:hypothetical protein WMY93_022834 [Mugilogobius chulae]|uniref:Uncharacterized protein n=1 Tax=Mugilogobius chulae TaxID=88201 RepID=A0AAW0NI49_9GOBI
MVEKLADLQLRRRLRGARGRLVVVVVVVVVVAIVVVVIVVAYDGASVMSGHLNGVQARFREKTFGGIVCALLCGRTKSCALPYM